MRQAHGCTESIDPAQWKMSREPARCDLCSLVRSLLPRKKRPPSGLTLRPSYKSFSTFNWPICRYRRSTPHSRLPPPKCRPRRRSPHRPAAASSSCRSGSGGPRFPRQLGDGAVAPDCRQRHLRLERRVVLVPCPLHVLLPRSPRFPGPGLHLSHLSHFRGPAHTAYAPPLFGRLGSRELLWFFLLGTIIRYIRSWNIRYIGLSLFFNRRRGGSLSRSRGAILVHKSKFSCKSQFRRKAGGWGDRA